MCAHVRSLALVGDVITTIWREDNRRLLRPGGGACCPRRHRAGWSGGRATAGRVPRGHAAAALRPQPAAKGAASRQQGRTAVAPADARRDACGESWHSRAHRLARTARPRGGGGERRGACWAAAGWSRPTVTLSRCRERRPEPRHGGAAGPAARYDTALAGGPPPPPRSYRSPQWPQFAHVDAAGSRPHPSAAATAPQPPGARPGHRPSGGGPAERWAGR